MVVVAVRPSQIIEQLRERDGGLRATAQSRGVVSLLHTGSSELSDVGELAFSVRPLVACSPSVLKNERRTYKGSCMVMQKELRDDYPSYKKKVARCVARSLEEC